MQTTDSRTVSSVAQAPSSSLQPLGPQSCGFQQYHFDTSTECLRSLFRTWNTFPPSLLSLSFSFLPFSALIRHVKLLLSESI